MRFDIAIPLMPRCIFSRDKPDTGRRRRDFAIERIPSDALEGEVAIVDPLFLNELELKTRIGVDSTRTISRSTPSSCGPFLQRRTHYDTSHLAERIGFDNRASGQEREDRSLWNVEREVT